MLAGHSVAALLAYLQDREGKTSIVTMQRTGAEKIASTLESAAGADNQPGPRIVREAVR